MIKHSHNKSTKRRGMGRLLIAFVMWCKQRLCKHRFALEDLKQTGIPYLPEPEKNAGYEAWEKYHRDFYTCDGHTKRVRWICDKCGREFFAHCGLDISPKYGPMFRRKRLSERST